MGWLIRTVVTLAVLAILGLGIGYKWLEIQFDAPGPLDQEQILVVDPGSGVSAIAARLKDAGLLKDPIIFRLGVRLENQARSLQAGEFLIPARASARQIMEILSSGRTLVRRLTVPEGLTSREIMDLVAAADALTGNAPEALPEGSLLPETYHYQRGDSRGELVGRMQESLQAALAELWPQRAEGLPLKNPEEAVILASIVEKETGVGGERPLVASVFYNRLAKGMPLQSDPTVIFALTKGKAPLGRALTRQDWKVDDPYNTYQNTGLPPGPIANPGRASLEAVLRPAESGYLYFVADGQGGHAFTKTLAEHNRNVQKLRRLRQQQSN
ncbi:endolytic transglycosylase MltG [Limibacillus sp. MBR-115]|jgi:UPF0755 protein|uniref:endolytic transglycosylase MltG n=1 Tax=Limibacillus sp. MBR-115 TaxID=3156465 RepID=UPI00339B0181